MIEKMEVAKIKQKQNANNVLFFDSIIESKKSLTPPI